MKHVFKRGRGATTLLLLHGTGGTEEDLLPVAKMIDPSASVLGVKGNVTENGMPRFFRRLAEGVFDEEDLIFRTGELQQFLAEASRDHGFDRDNVVAIGYSNGANIAASLLFHYERPLKGAVLLHPMVPRRNVALPDLSGIPVLVSAGRNDPLCEPQETEELARLLNGAGGNVDIRWHDAGHQLTKSEVMTAADWYKETLS